MTTRIAVTLALLIAGLIALDLWQGWGASLFAARKGIDVIHGIAVWR